MRLRASCERRVDGGQQPRQPALLDLHHSGADADVQRSNDGQVSSESEEETSMNLPQDIQDALKRLEHAIANSAPFVQAIPPSEAQQLHDARIANDQLRVRLAEQEALVAQERARADEAEGALARSRTALQNARIYVDRMTIQVGPIAHDELWQAKRALQLIDAVLEAHDA
jgi:hypothetical protein